MYSYRESIKSGRSDELINIYLIRPAAGLIVRLLYGTKITPNHVTIISIITGFAAGYFYLYSNPGMVMIAGLCVTLKDIFDSADGQLARAKSQYSRVGRFMDSIGDFAVNVFIFAAAGYSIFRANGSPAALFAAFLGLAGITLRVSYHVFYQVSFLHSIDTYRINRISETISKEDLDNPKIELMLQRIFQFIYGWQDKLMADLDAWSRNHLSDPEFLSKWYTDVHGLRISGLIGLGTELFVLMLFSLADNIELYLYVNIFIMNGILLASVFYRRMLLLKKLAYVKQA